MRVRRAGVADAVEVERQPARDVVGNIIVGGGANTADGFPTPEEANLSGGGRVGVGRARVFGCRAPAGGGGIPLLHRVARRSICDIADRDAFWRGERVGAGNAVFAVGLVRLDVRARRGDDDVRFREVARFVNDAVPGDFGVGKNAVVEAKIVDRAFQKFGRRRIVPGEGETLCQRACGAGTRRDTMAIRCASRTPRGGRSREDDCVRDVEPRSARRPPAASAAQ